MTTSGISPAAAPAGAARAVHRARARDDQDSRSLHFRDPLGNVIVVVQMKDAAL
ncbi:hypothetical protein [Sphaerisporangium album]|uniref:hypothetical protein n=1 Tax=Sphaerisporangium album TaxID=509200 RepID=UPI0015F0A651|nr:hypothetical protein [Sphaerisporangium album]